MLTVRSPAWSHHGLSGRGVILVAPARPPGRVAVAECGAERGSLWDRRWWSAGGSGWRGARAGLGGQQRDAAAAAHRRQLTRTELAVPRTRAAGGDPSVPRGAPRRSGRIPTRARARGGCVFTDRPAGRTRTAEGQAGCSSRCWLAGRWIGARPRRARWGEMADVTRLAELDELPHPFPGGGAGRAGLVDRDGLSRLSLALRHSVVSQRTASAAMSAGTMCPASNSWTSVGIFSVCSLGTIRRVVCSIGSTVSVRPWEM